MIVYRVSRLPYARDLTGKGSLIMRGRWHHKGTAVIYAASSKALAMAEKLVQQPVDQLPDDLVIVTLELAAVVPSLIPQLTLCPGWNALPATSASRDIGDDWLSSGQGLIASVPSAVVHGDLNYLINPLHKDASSLVIKEIEPMFIDERLSRT